MTSDTCETCRFFRKAPLEQGGACHAHPPTAFMLIQAGGRGYSKLGFFPPTKLSNWCGEYEPRQVIDV